MTTPTLLVGLGGIGSEIVDRIYAKIPEDKRSRIAVHAFDTDVNDISNNLKHLGPENITQTSTRLTVGQYLDKADETVKEWFPSNIKALHRKTLTDGAGQIRVISRLAYRSAMTSGKLDKLETQITNIFRTPDDDREHSIRVMIVSSLAGGTGSGIFLQTALYLRELLQENYGAENVLIRGAFMLPDVMIKCKVLPQQQKASVRYNGYAAIKELDAITQAANRVGDARNVTIELEYRPEQVSASMRKDHVITARHLPYNFVFLYDHENSSNQNIGTSFNNYKSQMVESIYLQLFSPIASKNFSLEDNLIREYVESQGRNFYGGAGVSVLTYPFEDMVEYLSLKWVLSALDEKWLKLDNEYEQLQRKYKANPDAFHNQPAPSLSSTYVKTLERMGRNHNSDLFFRNAYKSLFIYNEADEIIDSKAEAFKKMLYSFIDENLGHEAEILHLAKESSINEDEVSRGTAQDVINKNEYRISRLSKKVNELVGQLPNFIHSQVMLVPCDTPVSALLGHQLNHYILGHEKEETMHPVAMRSFLYQVKDLFGKELQIERTNANSAREPMEKYKESFNIKETPGVDTPATRMRDALKIGIFKKIFSDKEDYKAFLAEYVGKSKAQVQNIQKYQLSRVRELALTRILEDLDILINQFEKYFQDLGQVNKNLYGRLLLLGKKHENSVDTTSRYIFDSQEQKDRLWDEISPLLSGDETPVEISEQIYLNQYSRYCAAAKKQYVVLNSNNTESMFKETVLDWCQTKIRSLSSVDMDVVTALNKEIEYLSIKRDVHQPAAPTEHLKNRIRIMENQSKPFVPIDETLSLIRYWGINKDAVNKIPENVVAEMFGSDLITQNTEAFSRYEILCYTAAYGLRATDFRKFTVRKDGNGGKYFEAYNAMIESMKGSNKLVTPHLDRRWHLPYYLPDINPHKEKRDNKRLSQAFILGLIQGYFKPGTEHGAPVWIFKGPTAAENVKIGGENIPVKLADLHGAMAHNPHIVDQVHQMHGKQIQRDRTQFSLSKDASTDHWQTFESHQFYKGAVGIVFEPQKEPVNIFEIITSLPDSSPDDEHLIDDSVELVSSLMGICETYLQHCYGYHRKHQAHNLVKNFIQELIENSASYQQELAENSVLASKWGQAIKPYIEDKSI